MVHLKTAGTGSPQVNMAASQDKLFSLVLCVTQIKATDKKKKKEKKKWKQICLCVTINGKNNQTAPLSDVLLLL